MTYNGKYQADYDLGKISTCLGKIVFCIDIYTCDEIEKILFA